MRGSPGQRGFVDLEGNGVQQNAVRGDFFSGVQDDHVSDHHVAAGNFTDIAAADDLHHRVVVDLVQDFKFLLALTSKAKPTQVASRMATRMPTGSRKTLAGSAPEKNW